MIAKEGAVGADSFLVIYADYLKFPLVEPAKFLLLN
jgi:hypothetical protein